MLTKRDFLKLMGIAAPGVASVFGEEKEREEGDLLEEGIFYRSLEDGDISGMVQVSPWRGGASISVGTDVPIEIDGIPGMLLSWEIGREVDRREDLDGMGSVAFSPGGSFFYCVKVLTSPSLTGVLRKRMEGRVRSFPVFFPSLPPDSGERWEMEMFCSSLAYDLEEGPDITRLYLEVRR